MRSKSTPIAAFVATVERFESKRTTPLVGCWPWNAGCFGNGYGLFKDGPKLRRAHVIAWELATNETVPPGMHVLHTCDSKACTRNDDVGVYVVRGVEYRRVGHLWLGTMKANHEDREDKGRGRRLHGSDNPRSKLNEAQVTLIRKRYAAGHSQQAIAVSFGLKQKTVCDIVHGKLWAHVPLIDASERPKVLTRLKGESHHRAKLTENNVRTIRALLEGGTESVKEIAARFGVGIQAIYKIKWRTKWGHLV